MVNRLGDGSGLTGFGLNEVGIFTLAAFGPQSSFWAAFLSPIIEQQYTLPMLSTATDPILGLGELYPYFIRMLPSNHEQGSFLAQTLMQFDWLPICIIVDSSSYGSSLGVTIVDRIAQTNRSVFNILGTESRNLGEPDTTDVDRAIRGIARAQCKVVVVAADTQQTELVVRFAMEHNLLKGYHWILGDVAELSHLDAAEHVGLCWSFPYVDVSLMGQRNRLTVNLAIAADSLLVYAVAINALIEDRKYHMFDPAALARYAASVTLPDGYTGSVRFDEHYSRVGTYTLINLAAAGVKRMVLNEDAGGSPQSARDGRRSNGRSAHFRGGDPAGAHRKAGPRASWPGDRAPRSPARALVQLADIIYAGNQSTFDNRITYYVRWASNAPSLPNTTFLSTNEGDVVRPWPQVHVGRCNAEGNMRFSALCLV